MIERSRTTAMGGRDVEVIDTRAVNPNLDALHKHFTRLLSRYFTESGDPRPEYFEVASCYNCVEEMVASEFVIARFRHVRCARCGMVYVSPRLKEGVLHDSYAQDDYTAYYRLKLVPSLSYRREVLGRRKYAQVAAYLQSPGRVLDIGCGLGELLSVFKDNGWACRGIEFNPFAADFARTRFGLDVVAQSIFDFQPTEGTYDCIMLWGVLEHFARPAEVLAKAFELLRADGLLVLEVPNADSVLVRYFERFGGHVDRLIEGDRHIMLFSVRSLLEMTRRAGFKEVHLRSNGLDLDTLFRLNDVHCAPEIVARIQAAIDQGMGGDLLRGFWRR